MEVNMMLAGLQTGSSVIEGRLDLYSCKLAGTDKEVSRSLEQVRPLLPPPPRSVRALILGKRRHWDTGVVLAGMSEPRHWCAGRCAIDLPRRVGVTGGARLLPGERPGERPGNVPRGAVDGCIESEDIDYADPNAERVFSGPRLQLVA